MHLDPFTAYEVLEIDEIAVILRQEELDHIKLAVKEIAMRGAAWIHQSDLQKFKQMFLDILDIEKQVFQIRHDIKEEVKEEKENEPG